MSISYIFMTKDIKTALVIPHIVPRAFSTHTLIYYADSKVGRLRISQPIFSIFHTGMSMVLFLLGDERVL